MLIIRTILFTLLVPGVVAGVIPYYLCQRSETEFNIGGFHFLGLTAFLLGLPIFGESVLAFLLKGGTPAVWFTKPLRFLIGEEPEKLVSHGIYTRSRNPMYLGVLLVVFGEAIYLERFALMVYALFLVLIFYCVVVFIEEPHLQRKHGDDYQRYLREVPRWFGRRN